MSRPHHARPTHEPLEPRRLMAVDVTTYAYDAARTATNPHETTLTLANVNSGSFGKLASLPVDAQVYAQPLVLNGVAVPGQGKRDLVLVATENDTVYAFDAHGDDPAQGYLWKTSLLASGETAVPASDYGTKDITPLIGVTGTPVIDPATHTLYVVSAAKTKAGAYVQKLHALDVTTGAEKLGGPVAIAASVHGTGQGSSNGTLAFSPFIENQRPALTLANGNVYVGFAAHGDLYAYHGWLIAYSASTLKQTAAYCDSPDGYGGGIWMSGGGLAVDASGNLYFTTGNGTFDANTGGPDYGTSVEKLSPSLAVEASFTPYNQAALSNADLDYGCSSVILLPTRSGSHPNQILTQSKWGTFYLTDGTSLGGYTPGGPDKVLAQTNLAPNAFASNVHNDMAYFNGQVYLAGDGTPLKAYAVGNGTLSASATSQSAYVFGHANQNGQGAGTTISANGTANGIAWAVDNAAYGSGGAAVLYAYDAGNLGHLLYTSAQASGNRDAAAAAVKYQHAVVANGLVYVAGANAVDIYGLLSPARPSWLAATSFATYNATTKVLTVTGPTAIVADPGSALPVIQASGSAATVVINPASGSVVHLGGLSLSGGATVVLPSATARRTLVLGKTGGAAPTFAIDASSQLDLASNALVVHNGSLANITAGVKAGYGTGSHWSGHGIASDVAAGQSHDAVGVAQPVAAGTFAGEAVTTADVEVAQTVYGDTNLDGLLTAADFIRLDVGSVLRRTGWQNGDFNYDGVVDGSDYTLIDAAFNAGAAIATKK